MHFSVSEVIKQDQQFLLSSFKINQAQINQTENVIKYVNKNKFNFRISREKISLRHDSQWNNLIVYLLNEAISLQCVLILISACYLNYRSATNKKGKFFLIQNK